MELKKIVSALEEYNPKTIQTTDDPTYIQTYKILIPNKNRFFEECLYIGNIGDMPKELPDHECNIICIEDGCSLPEYIHRSNQLNLVVIDGDIEKFKLLNIISDIMIEESKLTSDMRILLDALHSTKGIHHLCDVAYQVFGNPIIINDLSYKIISYSSKAQFDDPTVEFIKAHEYVHSENVLALKKDNILSRLKRKNAPILSEKRRSSDSSWLFKDVRIENTQIAMIALKEEIRPFRKIDAELLERFSKLVAIEMQKEEFYIISGNTLNNLLLTDIISGELKNTNTIYQRFEYLSWPVHRYFALIIIEFQYQYESSDIIFVYQHIQHLLQENKTIIYNGKICALLSSNDPYRLYEKFDKEFEKYLSDHHLVCGISNPYSSITNTPTFYQQALDAIAIRLSNNRSEKIFFYNDRMIDHVLQTINNHIPLIYFENQLLRTLIKYDKENNSNLLDTLIIYIESANNSNRACERLFIHRNTLLYRLKKIEKLSPFDIYDGIEQFKFLLSYYLYERYNKL